MMLLCYFSISLSPSSLSLRQSVSQRILNCERFCPFSECTAALGSHPLGTTEIEWLKCSCPCLSLAVLSTLQPLEFMARVQACMHASDRSFLHLCICKEMRQDTATLLLADHAVRILFVTDASALCLLAKSLTQMEAFKKKNNKTKTKIRCNG